ncbi:Hypothetical predicted protein [Pelobates cultripes]|uniref:Uncharacterized protein n=1 Tax=Pelobates cultripes TaxID=61616 RepID=A0AAD1S2V6_PELCU|nr:Hypothetical predicted protein [Pelobates cultripes]
MGGGAASGRIIHPPGRTHAVRGRRRPWRSGHVGKKIQSRGAHFELPCDRKKHTQSSSLAVPELRDRRRQMQSASGSPRVAHTDTARHKDKGRTKNITTSIHKVGRRTGGTRPRG